MHSRQILQNKTAERRETATNKQEYKGQKLYILKKRKTFSNVCYSCYFFDAGLQT